jgi:hypothetical protein
MKDRCSSGKLQAGASHMDYNLFQVVCCFAVLVRHFACDSLFNLSQGGQVFSLSKSQLRILAESTVEAYLKRVTARIRDDFPSELGGVPGEELRLRVQAAFDRFRAQGFQRKEHLHRLIVLELLFGPQFETRLPPEARLFAFPPIDVPPSSETERFWAIYRSAEWFTYGDTPSVAPSSDVLARNET